MPHRTLAHILAAVLLGLCTSAALAQVEIKINAAAPAESAAPGTSTTPAATDSEATEKPAPKTPPDVVKVYMLDGSIITGKINLKEFLVETSYGLLKVPVADVLKITPGLDSHPEVAANMAALVDKLGSTEFNERETAQKELTNMGPTIRSELAKFAKDPDAERRNRVQAILAEIDQATDEDSGKNESWVRGDTLTTPTFAIVGTIQPRTFEMISSYGTLTIKLPEVRALSRNIAAARPETTKTVEVQGAHNANNNPLTTTIKVEKGDQITFSAEGSITLSPWGNRAISSPEGAANYGWFIPGQIPMGALVGRIGKDGQFFKIGNKLTMTADRAGVLCFGVGIQADFAGNNFPGSYKVKVKIKPKG